jgi:photosystem II stability/assembly factor-like uncharacterized protein
MSNRSATPVLIALAAVVAAGWHSEREADVDIAERMTVEQLVAKINPVDRQPTGPVRAVSAPPSGTLQWTFLGPQPITNEFWSGNTNASGRTSALVMDPTNPNTIYVAAAGGGVWMTGDGGSTWTPLTDQLSSLASGALVIDPNNPGTVLYGTGEQHYSADSFYGDGLFRTMDYGVTWTKIGLKGQVGNYIARVGVSTGTLHVCSDLGYVRSLDDGASWTAFKPGGAGSFNWCNDLVQSSQAPGTWFASFYSNGIYESTDDGATWTQLAGGLPTVGFQRINLGISDGNPNVVYASFINPAGGLFGMYTTTDGGTTWTRLSATPNYTCTQGWYDDTVAVSPTDPNTVIAGGVFPYGGSPNCGIVMSTDGGATWTNISVAADGTQVHPDVHSITFTPDGNVWVTCDGGVWMTSSLGTSWVNMNAGLGIAQFYTVALHPTDSSFLVGGTQDNGSAQYQGGPSWPEVIGGDGGPAAVEWSNPNQYYTTYVRMNPLYRWLRPLAFNGVVTGPWSAGERADWANGPLVVDPNTPSTLVAGTYHLWRTSNSGASWASISPDLTVGGVLRSLGIAPTDSNTMYSGSSDGQLRVTTNGGLNWVSQNAGLPAGRPIPDIVISPSDPMTLYLCVDQSSSGRVFMSSNGGVSWQDITGSLPAGLRGMTLAVDFSASVIYLGTDYGVYSTPDTGVTWTQEAINLPNVAVYNLRIDVGNGLIVAATHGRSMWEALLSGM